MKNILLTFLFFISSINSFSQSYFVTDSTEYKYYVGVSEPVSDWKKSSFNDAGWQTDTGKIGYGTNDIKTKISKTTSLYLRYKFTIKDKKSITTLGLACYFNDGYVAYLNGTEIARVNLGKPGDIISYNQLTDRSHKEISSKYYIPVGYYIDNSILSQCLNTGTNVLAIEVHNDSTDGSDLDFLCWIENISQGGFGKYRKRVEIDSTKFPLVIINTRANIYKKESLKAKMGIINKPNGLYNKPTDNFTDYDGTISIKIHGSSSSGFPKLSYKIETIDSAGNNYNVPLIGMPKENDWILFGPYADKTQIRNELAFNLGRKLGHYEPSTRFCELILNGEFCGLYVLTEKIKRDSNRVNVAKLKTTDNEGLEVTGGYIFSYQKGFQDTGILGFIYPKSEVITQNQKEYITNYIRELYDVLNKPDFSDPEQGYAKYIDVQSLIDYTIAEETMKNCDAYRGTSTYLYKEKSTDGGKIKYGPLWDHDLAFGNGSYQNGCITEGWQFETHENIGKIVYTNDNLDIMKIMTDSNFSRQFKEKWQEVRKSFLSTDSMMREIDSLALYIRDAQIRNYMVWPVINSHLFGACDYENTSYENEINKLKNWLEQRLIWIDKKTGIIDTTVNILSKHADSNIKVFPNPFSNNLSISYHFESHKNITCSIYNIFGQKVFYSGIIQSDQDYNEYVFNKNSLSILSQGIYLLTIYENGKLKDQTKLVKY